MDLKQLYRMLGKLECFKIEDKMKKLYTKLVEQRIQILEKENEKEHAKELMEKEHAKELMEKEHAKELMEHKLELEK